MEFSKFLVLELTREGILGESQINKTNDSVYVELSFSLKLIFVVGVVVLCCLTSI